MSFLDDEVDRENSSELLVPSSQTDAFGQAGPRKRRRIENPSASQSSDASDEYDLPSNTNGDLTTVDDDEFENQKSKYDALLHEPVYVESQTNVFVTQVDQPWSSPTRIRGPRWRKKSPTPPPSPSPSRETPSALPTTGRQLAKSVEWTTSTTPIVADEFDDEELEALIASHHLEPALSTSNTRINGFTPVVENRQQTSKSLRQTTLHGMNTSQPNVSTNQSRSHNWPLASRNEPPTHHKLNLEALKTWKYPLNVGKMRDYQFNIVHKSLFHNILVALPTGLGKTFIAATVMLNWFNWTREAQIVFVAPTKPLVSQQIDACFNIAGIPRSQTTLLTGEIARPIRREEWQEKRVFFMTPQTLMNDLKEGAADPKKIVLLVVDEAHKATGNYSYVEVVRFLRRFNTSFRVLALTATPGANVEAVQKVIDGLDIARVEIRTEESIDIRDFVHSRNTELEIFDYSDEINMCLELFKSCVKPVMDKLCSQNAYWNKDPTSITLYGLLESRRKWASSDAGRNAGWPLKSMVNACFTPLMSLAHNLELLKYHGIGPFYHKMKVFEDESSGGGKYSKIITEHADFRKLMNRLRAWINTEDFVGHPKLVYLKGVVLNHFLDAGVGQGRAGGRPPSDTRIMIFAHYRDSAEEITRVLNRHQPMIRAHVFVGQSGTKGSDGMDQKKQIDIIKKFKAGEYNTLVATSIGEEGLDIGEVDLIVCYDCSKSPIRMLQRMGRTGRKRAGNIVLLLMRGKEEGDYYKAKDNYSIMQAKIESGKEFTFHEDASPRIVPKDITPVVNKCHVEIPIENTQPGPVEPRRRATKRDKKPPKVFHMPDGVETGFSFLGNGNQSKKKIPTKKQPLLLDKHEAPLPALPGVLLSSTEEVELDERYAQIAGTEPQYIQVVQLDGHPDRLRRLDQVSLVKHSAVTKRLVHAMSTARIPGKSWDRPGARDIITNFAVEPRIEESSRRTESVNVSNERHSDLPTSQSSTGNSSENQYDLNDDFVDDAPINEPFPSQDGLSQDRARVGRMKEHSSAINDMEQPFYASQESIHALDSDAEGLPDINDLFTDKIQQAKPKGKEVLQRKGRRKVVSDDEEE